MNEDASYIGYQSNLVWLTIFIVTSLLIFLSNMATICTFFLNRHLRRHSVYCLLNLALVDAIHGLCSIFWYIWYIDWLGMDFLSIKLNTDGINLALGLVNTTTLMLSLLSLLLVSLDRVAATFFPFKHRAATRGTYVKIFTLTWLLAMVVAFIPVVATTWDIYGHNIWFETLDFLCILCLLIIIVCYTSVFINIKLRNKRVGQEVLNHARVKKERHLAMTLFIVTILSLFSWLPFIIKHEIDYSPTFIVSPAHHNLEMVTELIQLLNSLINPIVYVFRMKEFRRALFCMLCKCSSDRLRVRPIRSPALSGTSYSLPRMLGQELEDVSIRPSYTSGTS